MLRQLSCSIYSVFLILVLSNTNILVEACYSYETTCSTGYPYYQTWCCSSSSSCSSSYGSCISSSSNIPTEIVIPVIVIVGVFVLCACVAICRQCNRSSSAGRSSQYVGGPVYPVPNQQARYAQAQQPVQRTPRVTYVNPSAYVSTRTPIHNIREDLPPSYDAITRDTRYNSPPPSAPSAPSEFSAYQNGNFRV